MARRRAVARAGPSRIPAGLIFRLLSIVVILAAVVGVVLSAAGGFFTYRIVTDHNDTENVTPESFLLSNYESLNFTGPAGGEHAAWLLRGLRGAPVIVLCHGYDSNRSDLLSLGTVLQENHFNVYIFNFRPIKPKAATSDFGDRQIKIVQAAIDKVTKQDGINPSRIGLYGKNTGGYAAMAIAENNPMVKAIVVDNVYSKPIEMFNAQVDEVLGSTTLFRGIMDEEFKVMNLGSKAPDLDDDFSKLNPIPKFFISGHNIPALAALTEGFYARASQPKLLIVMDDTESGSMNDSEKKEYENQILTFFQQNLSLRSN